MKMRKFVVSPAVVLSLTAVVSTAMADVIVDENGVGSVGKGDVQDIYNWNNSELQANAANIQFRFLASGSATWQCQGVNPAGKTVISTHSESSLDITSAINYDARKNRQGQVTGFILNGVDASAQPTYDNLGACPYNQNWQVKRTMVEGSFVSESTDPVLQISIDGIEWYDLAITE